jgi:hypothetical protein
VYYSLCDIMIAPEQKLRDVHSVRFTNHHHEKVEALQLKGLQGLQGWPTARVSG